jgi:hypothetical protein
MPSVKGLQYGFFQSHRGDKKGKKEYLNNHQKWTKYRAKD